VANHAASSNSFAIGLMSPEPIVFVPGSSSRPAGRRSVPPPDRAVFVGSEGERVRSSIESVLSNVEMWVRSGLKGAKITIKPVSLALRFDNGRHPPWSLSLFYSLVPAPRPRCLVPSVRAGQGRRDRHAPSADAESSNVNATDVSGTGEAFEALVPLSYSRRNGRLVSASVQMP